MNNQRGVAPVVVILIVIVLLAGGILAWHYLGEPKEGGRETINENYCEKDTDCACGVNINTGNCFYGNKDYVDTTRQCPDFCTGIGGNLIIKCINNQCVQKPEEVADETTNWKIYRNEEYGFEIKYPSDVSVQDDGYVDYLNGIRMSFCGGEYAEFCGIKGAALHPEIYFFKFKKDGAEKELYSFVFENGKFPLDYWPFGVKQNNMNCKVFSITEDGGPGKLWDCVGGLFAFWERKKDDSFYNINVTSLDEFPKLRDTFNQMLSTFRFL